MSESVSGSLVVWERSDRRMRAEVLLEVIGDSVREDDGLVTMAHLYALQKVLEIKTVLCN